MNSKIIQEIKEKEIHVFSIPIFVNSGLMMKILQCVLKLLVRKMNKNMRIFLGMVAIT
jgi:hypothetical protein